MTDDAFAALPPVPESVVIAGESIAVTPLKVGELPAFARAIRPIATKLASDPDWWSLLAEDGDAMIQAIAIASRQPVEWVSGLALDDAVKLADALFGANADFFIRRVVPEITRAGSAFGRLIPGQTPSSGSSDPATSTKTS